MIGTIGVVKWHRKVGKRADLPTAQNRQRLRLATTAIRQAVGIYRLFCARVAGQQVGGKVATGPRRCISSALKPLMAFLGP